MENWKISKAIREAIEHLDLPPAQLGLVFDNVCSSITGLLKGHPREVWVVYDSWSNDPYDVCAICATEALADAYITTRTSREDDYEQAHHHFSIKRWDLQWETQ